MTYYVSVKCSAVSNTQIIIIKLGSAKLKKKKKNLVVHQHNNIINIKEVDKIRIT